MKRYEELENRSNQRAYEKGKVMLPINFESSSINNVLRNDSNESVTLINGNEGLPRKRTKEFMFGLDVETFAMIFVICVVAIVVTISVVVCLVRHLKKENPKNKAEESVIVTADSQEDRKIEQLRKKHAKDDGGSNNKWSSHSGGNSMHSAKARLRASGVSLTRCPSQNSRSVKSACIKDSIAQQMVGSGSGQTGSGQMLQQRYQSGERRSVS